MTCMQLIKFIIEYALITGSLFDNEDSAFKYN